MTNEELIAGAKRLRRYIHDFHGGTTLHGWWDVISDVEMHAMGGPGILKREDTEMVLQECLAKLDANPGKVVPA